MKCLVLCDLDKTILDAAYCVNSQHFRASVRAFQRTGNLIGLNSDTPLVKLLEHQQEFGMAGPTVAELGGIVRYRREVCIRRGEQFWIGFRRAVAEHLASQPASYTTVIGDATAVVKNLKQLPGARDGILVVLNNLRRASFSCFVRRVKQGEIQVEAKALKKVAALILGLYRETGAPECKSDMNEEYGIIILHDREAKKQDALPTLERIFRGHTIFMIGDSMNDYMGDKGVIYCGVGNASEDFKSRCHIRAPRHLCFARGVEFLLHNITSLPHG